MKRGMRAIALLEATKGGLALLVLAGLLLWIGSGGGQPLQLLADWHLAADQGVGRWLLAMMTPERIQLGLWLVAAYMALRFAEAYGLWRELAWGEWLAALSGGLYLPFELAEMRHGVSLLWIAILLFNLAVVLYVSRALYLRRVEAGEA